MNKPVPTKSDGKITMDDIRRHLANFGKEIPHVLPMTSNLDEKPEKEAPGAASPKAKEDKAISPGLGPLDTSGLHEKLIHNPRDVNSPY